MNGKKYLKESQRTTAESKDRIVSVQELSEVARCFDIGNMCDIKKRHTFYLDNNTAVREKEHDDKYNSLLEKLSATEGNIFELTQKQMNIYHALLGIISESGEIVEEFIKSILENRDIDDVNMVEEVGDIMWYQAMLLRAVNGTFEDSMDKNIKKLKKRYPNKFSLDSTLNRDIDGEREILEGTINSQKDE